MIKLVFLLLCGAGFLDTARRRGVRGWPFVVIGAVGWLVIGTVAQLLVGTGAHLVFSWGWVGLTYLSIFLIGGGTRRQLSGTDPRGAHGELAGGFCGRPLRRRSCRATRSRTMWKDPIVEEVRRAREEIAAEHGYDLEVIRRSFEEREAQGEFETVRWAPRRSARGRPTE